MGIILSTLVLFISCSQVKYVPENKYLLTKNKIHADEKKLEKDELKNYLRQNPNKRILGLRFHLGLYNLSSKKKDNSNSWWRKIGEEPVIYDPLMKQRSNEQLKQFLNNKGYYNSVVTDSTIFREKKQKTEVLYFIRFNEPYRINELNYVFEDTSLRDLVCKDTSNTLIKEDNLLDVDVLRQERLRIEEYLKNMGYFNFTRDYIYYELDTSIQGLRADIDMNIKKFLVKGSDGKYQPTSHRLYKIGDVYIFSDYDTKKALMDYDNYISDLDTIKMKKGIYFIRKEKYPMKPRSLIQYSYIQPGDLYRLYNIEQTQKHLSSLQVFKLTNVQFVEVNEKENDSIYQIDCNLNLSPRTMQSYTAELEGTNSENIGGAAVLTYNHRNLFRGAEHFNVKLRGAIEAISDTNINIKNKIEIGAEVSIQSPKFLLPLNTTRFVKKFHPKTTMLVAFNYQKRPDYVRYITNSSFGYNWKGNRYLSHIYNPIELNAVNTTFRDDSARINLQEKYINIWNSFENHFVVNSSYSAIYTNQMQRAQRNFIYVRWNVEAAGNILYGIYKASNKGLNEKGYYELLGTEFAQYLKTDIDFRYYQFVNPTDKIVYRVFFGIGLPYSNSTTLPYEERYFSGGAYSMRAWRARSLGPGGTEPVNVLSYFNSKADMKIEANLEYRFNLFWKVEGALFADAGNIWDLKTPYDEERAEAYFEFGNFYKQIAVATGFGLRLDLSFFVFRLDYAIKARDPIHHGGNEWIFGNRSLTREDWSINLGIGYPF